MDEPADIYPRPQTKAERSARNKAARALRQAAFDAEVEARKTLREQERARREELAASARASAQARAAEAMSTFADSLPRTQGEVRQIAKALTPRMMQLLVEIAEDPTQQASGRVSAINAVVDRGFGKPVQPTVELPGAVLEDMDDERLDAYLLQQTSKFIDGKVIEHVQQGDGTRRSSDDETAARLDAGDDQGSEGTTGRRKGRRAAAPQKAGK